MEQGRKRFVGFRDLSHVVGICVAGLFFQGFGDFFTKTLQGGGFFMAETLAKKVPQRPNQTLHPELGSNWMTD